MKTTVNIDWYVDNFNQLDYDEYTIGLTYCYERIIESSTFDGDNTESIQLLTELRPLIQAEQQQTASELNIVQAEEPEYINNFEKKLFQLYGFYASKRDFFLLKKRFVVPIYATDGKLISLVGWFPDLKKYVTIPTRYFNKKLDWFNLDQALPLSLNNFNGLIYIVEGIFDAISLRSIGLPAIATMGSTVEVVKGEVLKLFNKVIMFADNDEAGLRAINRWKIPSNTTKIIMHADIHLDVEKQVKEEVFDPVTQTYSKVDKTIIEQMKVELKDPDDLVTYLQPQGVRELLLNLAASTKTLEFIELDF